MFQFLICGLFLSSLDAIRISGTNSMNVTKGKMWLTIHIVPATWHDAALMCQLTDGILASPTTSGIVYTMQSVIANYRLSSGVFIGVTDLLSRGDYKSLDGVPIANIPLEWANGEPNNVDNSQRCLAITSAGALADVSCYGVLPYFCRNDDSPFNQSSFALPMATPPPSSCGYLFGYKWDPRTNSCYKFHSYALIFSQAWDSCAYEGGYLAIINNLTEAMVLQELFNNNLNRMPVSNRQQDFAFLGFLKNSTYYWMKDKKNNETPPDASSDEFVTIQGQTLTAAGFSTWAPGEPFNSSSTSYSDDCGVIYSYDGLLASEDCLEEFAYICEFNP